MPIIEKEWAKRCVEMESGDEENQAIRVKLHEEERSINNITRERNYINTRRHPKTIKYLGENYCNN